MKMMERGSDRRYWVFCEFFASKHQPNEVPRYIWLYCVIRTSYIVSYDSQNMVRFSFFFNIPIHDCIAWHHFQFYQHLTKDSTRNVFLVVNTNLKLYNGTNQSFNDINISKWTKKKFNQKFLFFLPKLIVWHASILHRKMKQFSLGWWYGFFPVELTLIQFRVSVCACTISNEINKIIGQRSIGHNFRPFVSFVQEKKKNI